ncbi:MAG: hypothetical protein U1F47_05905 [Hyphomicrobiales bacterium]
MKRIKSMALAALALTFVIGDVEIAGHQVNIGFIKFVEDAQAVIGRPATPGSVAGVARRTTRRVIRRGAYVGALPAGCVYGNYYGYSLYSCGGTYYQRSGGGYVVVYF